MKRELDPVQVAERLSKLRALYVPETVAEARARLAREQPRPRESIEQVAERSLAELRALCELARELHRVRPLDRAQASGVVDESASAQRRSR